MTVFFTEVECRADVVAEWSVRFGRDSWSKPFADRRTIVGFAPNEIFAYRRTGWDRMRKLDSLSIVQSRDRGADIVTLPGITPGADILLRVTTAHQVDKAIAHIDAIEALRIPSFEVAPTYWRTLHNYLVSGQTPPQYTAERHRAWLLRKKTAK